MNSFLAMRTGCLQIKIMKTRHFFLAILALAMVFGGILSGQSMDLIAQLDQIRAVLKPADSDSQEIKTLKSSLLRYPDNWQNLLEKDQLAQFNEYGPRSMGVDFSSLPGLSEKIDVFAKSVREELERRDNAKINEVETLLARVGEELKSARKAEDLDGLLLDLGKAPVRDYGVNPKLSALSGKIQCALQIVGNWQEYLIAEEAGNSQESRNNLQQISSQLSQTPIIPRSIVLRLLNPSAAKSSETAGIRAGSRFHWMRSSRT